MTAIPAKDGECRCSRLHTRKVLQQSSEELLQPLQSNVGLLLLLLQHSTLA
jgi:hypothetical protein